MGFLRFIAVMAVTMAGYSAGTAAARRKAVAHGLGDLLVLVVLWSAAFYFRAEFGHWTAMGVWLLAGLVSGLVAAPFHREAPTHRAHETDAHAVPGGGVREFFTRF